MYQIHFLFLAAVISTSRSCIKDTIMSSPRVFVLSVPVGGKDYSFELGPSQLANKVCVAYKAWVSNRDWRGLRVRCECDACALFWMVDVCVIILLSHTNVCLFLCCFVFGGMTCTQATVETLAHWTAHGQTFPLRFVNIMHTIGHEAYTHEIAKPQPDALRLFWIANAVTSEMVKVPSSNRVRTKYWDEWKSRVDTWGTACGPLIAAEGADKSRLDEVGIAVVRRDDNKEHTMDGKSFNARADHGAPGHMNRDVGEISFQGVDACPPGGIATGNMGVLSFK
jgi:hypothetical protein